MPLLSGGSGIALGLPANDNATPATPAWDGIQGPGVVISGSCSRATRTQVATLLAQVAGFQIKAETAVAGGYDVEAMADWVLMQNTPPLV
ncbi:hypothetical protein PSJ8397_01882 [Pseudooctadecabacter jejudonensis]|uniref:Uncharacterized protein n=2 Tax=Pseudooctadecabacter jejudonensis TaxID=1391910 RepID=A0A1Y5SIE8_9RHOB|nr:hypothetical protein PSJ8397_01882 [Pseudooctadecabacter jejudonensis]